MTWRPSCPRGHGFTTQSSNPHAWPGCVTSRHRGRFPCRNPHRPKEADPHGITRHNMVQTLAKDGRMVLTRRPLAPAHVALVSPGRRVPAEPWERNQDIIPAAALSLFWQSSSSHTAGFLAPRLSRWPRSSTAQVWSPGPSCGRVVSFFPRTPRQKYQQQPTHLLDHASSPVVDFGLVSCPFELVGSLESESALPIVG